ncbi:dihydropyrimidinase [Frigidibacter sp.]|uniref:dihydropyrimidinase n=1 Tax=Frigidibacter sp. TaxID=2586418 RepID=UPI0027337B05|nr:dihydropyrimidinase [Frigidibacter sp.]MDP3342433.1 dihydropyrimidinase [Frigidibacter sp.]
MTLIVTNGRVVTAKGVARCDVVAEGETITAVLPAGEGVKAYPDAEVIDATGRIVIPGGVDPHVHLLVGFMGQRSVYDFASGGIAALRGGTTAIVDFALQRRGGSMLKGLAHRRKQADANVTLDYGLHLIVTDVNAETLAELPALRAAGVSTLKVYTVYEEDGLKVEDGALFALMEAAARHGLSVVLHAENAGIVERLRAEAVARGDTHPRHHALTRPPIVEIEAVSRAIAFSRVTGCGVHILHLVAADAIALVAAARAEGLPVTAETCSHYLALTDEALERPNGHEFILSPPLRDKANQDRLWKGLESAALSLVASDEVSYSAVAKAMGLPSFATVANGITGIEARLPLLYTLGVDQGRIGLQRFVELFSTWPAEIFGFAGKGRIAPGYDADLVLIDPDTRRVMSTGSDYGDIGYNPYAGMELTGFATETIYRGKLVVRDGAFLGTEGQGRFIERSAPCRPAP